MRQLRATLWQCFDETLPLKLHVVPLPNRVEEAAVDPIAEATVTLADPWLVGHRKMHDVGQVRMGGVLLKAERRDIPVD